MKKIFKMDIEKIQPTTLYILKEKYEAINLIENDYEALPIKKIGDLIFLLDKHEIALYLANKGIEKINVFYETYENFDIISYYTKIKWCRENKIFSIKDLSGYVVNKSQYKSKWIIKCKKLNKRISKNHLQDFRYITEENKIKKQEICNIVLKSLPRWFGLEQAIIEYSNNVRNMEFIKIELFGNVIGFCAYKVNYGINCDLYVLGIYKEFHRYGIGSELLKVVNELLKKENVRYISVKTLSERNSDKYYNYTRNFYIKNGFYPFEEFKDLWDKDNPCLLMIKEVN